MCILLQLKDNIRSPSGWRRKYTIATKTMKVEGMLQEEKLREYFNANVPIKYIFHQEKVCIAPLFMCVWYTAVGGTNIHSAGKGRYSSLDRTQTSVRSIATDLRRTERGCREEIPSEHWPLPGIAGEIWPDLFGHEFKLRILVPNDWSYKEFKIIFRGVQRWIMHPSRLVTDLLFTENQSDVQMW